MSDLLPPALRAKAAILIGAIDGWARRAEPMPKNDALCDLVGCRKTALRTLLERMARHGVIDMEITESARRVRLPGGAWTPWAKWARDPDARQKRRRAWKAWQSRRQRKAALRAERMEEGAVRPDKVLFGNLVAEVTMLRRRGYEIVAANGSGFFKVDNKMLTAADLVRLAARQPPSSICTVSPDRAQVGPVASAAKQRQVPRNR